MGSFQEQKERARASPHHFRNSACWLRCFSITAACYITSLISADVLLLIPPSSLRFCDRPRPQDKQSYFSTYHLILVKHSFPPTQLHHNHGFQLWKASCTSRWWSLRQHYIRTSIGQYLSFRPTSTTKPASATKLWWPFWSASTATATWRTLWPDR